MSLPLDTILERSYWIAQILLVIIAAGAVIAAFTQIHTFRLFELLRFLQEHRIRSARRTLFKEIKNLQGDWWNQNDELEEVAATVCASYDIVGHLARGRNRRFFKRYWAYSICWTHEILEGFLRSRRETVPDAYHGYSKLYEDAKQFDPRQSSRQSSDARPL